MSVQKKSTKAAAVNTKTLSSCALLTAAALILSYIESLLPVFPGVPGIKVGFANIAVVFALYRLGAQYALYVNIIRIAIAALLFGSLFSGLYALAGGLFSLLVMVLLKKAGVFSITGVSMAGGAAHNLAQLAVAAMIVRTPQIVLYLPILLIAGTAAGIFNGIICNLVLQKLR